MIERILDVVSDQRDAAIVGNGDDAAVIAIGDEQVVIAVDSLVQDRHFRLEWSGGEDIGAKAVARSCADIAAMGARSLAVVVALCAPANTPVALVEAIAQGVRTEADRAGAHVVGGDTTESGLISLAVTAIGSMGGHRPITRGGAQPGDVLVVSGSPGRSHAGLRALRDGVDSGFIDANLRPRPDYAMGPQLSGSGATSLIDVSDGLVGDVRHLAESSGVAIDIETALLPVADGLTVEDVLVGGEDHVFAATLPADAVVPEGVTVIGRVSAGKGLTVDGGEPPTAWEHFR